MLQRIPLSQFPINKNQDIEIAYMWFREFISEKDWEQRKNKIEDYLSGTIRTSEPFSEPIS